MSTSGTVGGARVGAGEGVEGRKGTGVADISKFTSPLEARTRMSASNITTKTEEGAAFSSNVAQLLKGSGGRMGDGNKLTPLEERQLQAQMGAGRGQAASYFLDRENEVVEITEEDVGVAGAGGEGEEGEEKVDRRGKTTLMFKGCKGCEYTISGMVAKILVDRCVDCTFVVNGKVMTSTLEVYKAERVAFRVGTTLKTVQADMCEGVSLTWDKAENFDRVVWAGTEGLELAFDDAPDAGMATGYTAMQGEYGANLREDIDQFIIRILDEGVAVNERIVRLDNGFPTTAREREEFEIRQEENMRKMAKEFYGEDIIIPARDTGAKAQPNKPCPCGSGIKYKKCCRNRPGVTFTKEQVDAAQGGKGKKGKKGKKRR